MLPPDFKLKTPITPKHKMRVAKTLYFQGFYHSQNCICSLFVA